MGWERVFFFSFSCFHGAEICDRGGKHGGFKGRTDKKKANRKRKTGKTGACAVSFDRGPLQRYQMEASE